jgi:hypothetical protein
MGMASVNPICMAENKIFSLGASYLTFTYIDGPEV